MKKIKFFLLTILLALCLDPVAQVPNNESFSLLDVRTSIGGSVPAVARVDQIIKNDSAANATVSCNGFSQLMVWNTDIPTTIAGFITAHGEDFGAVTLYQTESNKFTITADVAGVDFAAATITTGIGTASNIVANNPGGYANSLSAAFLSATAAAFDSRYYPHYLVPGDNLLVENTLLNFRNYNGTPKDGIPIPVATAATFETPYLFTANWNASTGATKYYIDVSGSSDFSTPVCSPNYYDKKDVGNVTSYQVSYCLETSGIYYYRLYADTPNGISSYSNTITIDLPDPPPPEAPVATEETNNTYTAVDLNWNAVNGATGYYLTVWVGTEIQAGYNLKDVGNVTSFHFTHTYTDLTVEYSYRVKAYNPYGTSNYSNIIYFIFCY